MASVLLDRVRGAGPREVFWTGYQARGNGITFDVGADLAPFQRIAHPVVKGFILPEVASGEIQQLICVARGCAFDEARESCQWSHRRQQDVNVVGHDRVGSQNDPLLIVCSVERGNNALSDARVAQPKWADIGAIQGAVEISKSLPRIRDDRDFLEMTWKGALETPGQKDILSRRMPVREITFVVSHD